MEREQLPDGSLRLKTSGVSFTYTRLRPGALRVHLHGYNRGDLGPAGFEPLAAELERHAPLDLLVDTRTTEGATSAVSTAFEAAAMRLVPGLRRLPSPA
ncbi:hypothetical protein ACLESD_15950 [Pyxidicoccus sp. 3LFB2]